MGGLTTGNGAQSGGRMRTYEGFSFPPSFTRRPSISLLASIDGRILVRFNIMHVPDLVTSEVFSALDGLRVATGLYAWEERGPNTFQQATTGSKSGLSVDLTMVKCIKAQVPLDILGYDARCSMLELEILGRVITF